MILTNHSLPEASSARVLGEAEVTLQAHLTSEWGKDLAGLRSITWELFALKQDLEEDLSIAVYYASC